MCLFERRVSQWTNSNHVTKPAVVRSLNTKPCLDYPKFKSMEQNRQHMLLLKCESDFLEQAANNVDDKEGQ